MRHAGLLLDEVCCLRCGSPDETPSNGILLCDGIGSGGECPSALHQRCHSPPLDVVPDCKWFCAECTRCADAGVEYRGRDSSCAYMYGEERESRIGPFFQATALPTGPAGASSVSTSPDRAYLVEDPRTAQHGAWLPPAYRLLSPSRAGARPLVHLQGSTGPSAKPSKTFVSSRRKLASKTTLSGKASVVGEGVEQRENELPRAHAHASVGFE